MPKLKIKRWKQLVISFLLTCIITYLLSPIYTYTQFFANLNNKKLIITVYNAGNQNNALVPITQHKDITSGQCSLESLSCNGYMIKEDISHSWKKVNLKFKTIGDGSFYIKIKGEEQKHKDKTINPTINYKNFVINGHKIFLGTHTRSYNTPLKNLLNVKNDEIIDISIDIKNSLAGIDKLMFLSVLIVSFLFSYKLTEFTSKLKINDRKCIIDIVFLTTFICLLFIPMSHISNADKSTQENRRLAKYPYLLTEHGINTNFHEQFDSWFNDRFFGRNQLLKINHSALFNINNNYKVKKVILFKNSGWMFDLYNTQVARFFTKSPKKIIEQANLLDDFLKKHNIKLYILIAPEKSHIYPEKMVHIKNFAKTTDLYLKLTDEFLKNFSAPTIFPYHNLQEAAKKDFVYFKQSHHWTDLGAYIGYLSLMNTIKKDYPQIYITSLDEYTKTTSNLIREDWERDFGTGQTTRSLNIDSKYAEKNLLKDDYTYYDHKKIITPKIVDKPLYRIKYFKNEQQPKAPRVFLTGTSMNENLLQFLPYSFSETIYFRLNNVINVPEGDTYKLLHRYKNYILQIKPDILILSLTSENLINLINLCEE